MRTKPLLFFDLETTGVDTAKDRIVQIASIKIDVDGSVEEKNVLINPEMSIPVEASEVHGIYDKDVADKPIFKAYAKGMYEYFSECDLGGYNIKRYDIPLLVEEFLRAGIEPDFSFSNVYDVFEMYCGLNPRTLEAAYLNYTKKEMKNAHDALADTTCTFELYQSMLEKHGEGTLNEHMDTSEVVDYSRKFVRDENNNIIYNFGKDKGNIVKPKDSFLDWMLRQDFTMDTKRWVNKIKRGES